MVRHFYVLAYDISSDRRRLKIARLMESHGERVQNSVFEAYLKPGELQELLKKARRHLELKEDSLRVYMLCADCRQKVHTEGPGQVREPPGLIIV